MFKDYFKYYKSRQPPPRFEEVIDLNCPDFTKVIQVPTEFEDRKLDFGRLGLKALESWEIYRFLDISGLIFIKNPFTSLGQRYWITNCLKNYSKHPNKLNIDAHNLLDNNETWWGVCTNGNNKQRAFNLISKLRWATMGYHHDWDTKHYSENSKTSIPEELLLLSKCLAEAVGFPDFAAEAAIINYYRMNSTLAGHVDHSEINTEAPLISISFGQTSVFLIGGLKPEDPATPIFLRSGDVIIMSGESRFKYHGVPKILPADVSVWNNNGNDGNSHQHDDNQLKNDFIKLDYDENDWSKTNILISETRINMNVRQVLKAGQTSLPLRL